MLRTRLCRSSSSVVAGLDGSEMLELLQGVAATRGTARTSVQAGSSPFRGHLANMRSIRAPVAVPEMQLRPLAFKLPPRWVMEFESNIKGVVRPTHVQLCPSLYMRAFISPDFVRGAPIASTMMPLAELGECVLQTYLDMWIEHAKPRASSAELADLAKTLTGDEHLSSLCEDVWKVEPVILRGVDAASLRSILKQSSSNANRSDVVDHRVSASCARAMIGAVSTGGGLEEGLLFVRDRCLVSPELRESVLRVM